LQHGQGAVHALLEVGPPSVKSWLVAGEAASSSPNASVAASMNLNRDRLPRGKTGRRCFPLADGTSGRRLNRSRFLNTNPHPRHSAGTDPAVAPRNEDFSEGVPGDSRPPFPTCGQRRRSPSPCAAPPPGVRGFDSLWFPFPPAFGLRKRFSPDYHRTETQGMFSACSAAAAICSRGELPTPISSNS